MINDLRQEAINHLNGFRGATSAFSVSAGGYMVDSQFLSLVGCIVAVASFAVTLHFKIKEAKDRKRKIASEQAHRDRMYELEKAKVEKNN